MYNQETQDKVNELIKQNVSTACICKKTGVSLPTVKRWAKIRESRLLVKKLIFNRKYIEALNVINYNLKKHNVFKSVFSSYKIKIFLKQGEFEEAEKLAKAGLAKEPSSKYFESQIVTSLLLQNKIDEAEQKVRLFLEEEPNCIMKRTRLLGILKQQNRFDEAEKLAVSLLSEEPKNEFFKKELNDILLSKKILLEQSNKPLTKNILFNIIRSQEYDCDNFSVSIKNIELIKEYIRKHPNSKLAPIILAEAYFKMGLKDMAISICKNTIYSKNISIKNLKAFKQMIQIAKSNKPVFNNTIQKINYLVERIVEKPQPKKLIKK